MSPTKNNSQFQRHCAGFMRNQRGSISVITVATMVPLMIAAGSAIDMGKANRTIGHMQKAVDTAALAGAATTQSYTGEAAKIDAAVRMVAANLPDQIKKGAEDPVVTVDGDVVVVELGAKMETAFMKLVGIDTMSLSVTAAAEATIKAIGCIVALGPNGDGIEAGGNVDLKVEGCWLYSNKKGDKSINVIGGAKVDTPGTCSVGPTSVSSNAQVSGKRYTNCNPIRFDGRLDAA